MPVSNGIGHSEWTADKEAGLDALLRQHISIVRAVTSKHPYYPQAYIYIDTNAGDGCNAAEGCDGSPIVFLKVAQDRIPYQAYFIDRELANTFNLAKATSIYNHHEIFTEDNATCLPKIARRLNKNSYGLIYTDPTGIPNFDMLSEASKLLPRIDLLIRYSGSSAKRNGRDLKAELDKIGKEIWLIRELNPSDKHQWSFLFGTNYTEYKPWRKYGFRRTDDKEGAEIFAKLTYTKDELARQLQLSLLDSPRNQAIERSGGLCERCHKNPVTEPHHLRYGQDITASDIIAVCHECHCELEGKEN